MVLKITPFAKPIRHKQDILVTTKCATIRFREKTSCSSDMLKNRTQKILSLNLPFLKPILPSGRGEKNKKPQLTPRNLMSKKKKQRYQIFDNQNCRIDLEKKDHVCLHGGLLPLQRHWQQYFGPASRKAIRVQLRDHLEQHQSRTPEVNVTGLPAYQTHNEGVTWKKRLICRD